MKIDPSKKKLIEKYDELFSAVRPFNKEKVSQVLSVEKHFLLHNPTSVLEKKWKISLPHQLIVGACEAKEKEDDILKMLKILHSKDIEDKKEGIKNGRNWLPILYPPLTRGYFKIAKFLIYTAKVPIDQTGQAQETTLYLLAETSVRNSSNEKKQEYKKCIKFLLKNGADIKKAIHTSQNSIGRKIYKDDIKINELLEICAKELENKKKNNIPKQEFLPYSDTFTSVFNTVLNLFNFKQSSDKKQSLFKVKYKSVSQEEDELLNKKNA
jgi:hypothetical protein